MKKFMKNYLTVLCIISMLQNAVFAGATGAIQSTAKNIVNFVAYVGYAVALGMLAYVAIKYMLSAANDKANLKQGLINYLIGAFLIAGASLVANTVASIAGGGSGIEDMANDIISGLN